MNHHVGAGNASSLEEQCILLTAELFPGSSVMLERFQEGGRAPQLQLRDLFLSKNAHGHFSPHHLQTLLQEDSSSLFFNHSLLSSSPSEPL